jgi:hypothetical protein
MATKAAAPHPRLATDLAASGGLDPFQREHELADAILTLMIACSRYGAGDDKPRETGDRLATLEHITGLVTDEVAERVCHLRGKQAATRFRAQLRRRRA